MSAELLAVAARAAAHYVKVRGPWLPPYRTILIEPTPYTSWCTVRESHPGKHGETVLFNPLPRKEMPMPAPPPMPDDAFHSPSYWVGRLEETVRQLLAEGWIPTPSSVATRNAAERALKELERERELEAAT